MDAAAAVDAPVIIQASRGARSYANDIMLAKMIEALEEMHPQIPLCLHQDHGNEESTCATALQHGFTSVMMDGSLKADAKTAASYEYNVDITRRVVDMAHWIGARWKVSWACSARSSMAAVNRKTAMASKARSATINC